MELGLALALLAYDAFAGSAGGGASCLGPVVVGAMAAGPVVVVVVVGIVVCTMVVADVVATVVVVGTFGLAPFSICAILSSNLVSLSLFLLEVLSTRVIRWS